MSAQISKQDATTLLSAVVTHVRSYVERTLTTTLGPLVKRIDDLESRPVLIYHGIWHDGTEYTRGAIVTRNGSAWHCDAEKTTATPGASGDWKLMVKSGRDAR